MGTWSEAILGNDTSCEVRERFFELYDNGENPENIADIVLNEQQENLEYDRTNVWLGLALACWECKVLTNEILAEVKKIIETNEDVELSKKLGADNKFLKKREKILNNFLVKISKEKDKPRLRKKEPKQVATIYLAGMCCAYKNQNGKYIGVYITKSEHYKNRGEIRFFFLDFASDNLPTLKMFVNSTLYVEKLGKSWGEYEYGSIETGISYEKDEKENFFKNIPQLFYLVGTLRKLDDNKLINDFSSRYIDLNEPNSIVKILEQMRLEMQTAQKAVKISLGQLLEKIGENE